MKGRYQREVQAAEAEYDNALKAYDASEKEKKAKVEQLKVKYEASREAFLRKVQQRDQEVSELEAAYKSGDPSAIKTYTTMVLERSEYPEGFIKSFRLAYAPESKEMVVEYELPWINVIPNVSEYKYNKSKDEMVEKARKSSEIKTAYQDIVAAITIRTIHEILEADQGNHIQVVTFNGFVTTTDPATGKDTHPCLVSVRTTKDSFNELNLGRVDKLVCLRNLGAQVSSRPDEQLPVKPVVEFDMVDKRFIEQGDVLSDIDSRPNLMELTPSEFENLVSNLFGKMGLETKLTRASKDGGVDAVAFDTRPILGGKVVIQAKRYKNTVGVSAVRDLYGTMLNEGASKGIIVATSSYGPDAYEFSKDKPLELIDGGGLLYLLDQVGVKAKIIMPEE
jgi:restriction system protein